MANTVYILCAITSIACAILLLRSYYASGVRLVLWSGLCFTFLSLNNILLVLDLTFLPEVDLSTIRAIPEVVGLGLLLYGFIWDEHE